MAEVEHVLDAVGVSGRHRHRARRALLGERLSGIRLGACWVLRLPAEASFWQQMRQAHLPHHLVGLLGAYATQYLCWILAWWLLGRGALHGRLDPAWLLAWGLLFVTVIPLRLWSTWVAGPVGIRGRRVAENPLARGCPAPCPRGDAPSGGRAIPGAGVGGRGRGRAGPEWWAAGPAGRDRSRDGRVCPGDRGWGLAPCGAAGGLAGGGRRPWLALVAPAATTGPRPASP